MFKHMPELSIWEISHHWHGYSPDETDPRRLPSAVQGTLRVLAVASAKGSVVRLPPDSLLARFIGPFFLMLWGLGIQIIANRAFLHRRFNKRVFDGLRIRREELARWCKENNTPLPSFWFPENEPVPELNAIDFMKKFAGDRLVFPLATPDVPIVYDKKKPAATTPKEAPQDPSSTNSQQISAAQQAHARRNELISNFLRSIQDEIGKQGFNGTKAALCFYQDLTEEQQLFLAQSPEKAGVVTTTSRAST